MAQVVGRKRARVGDVEFFLDVHLVEYAGGDPSAKGPRCALSASFRPPTGIAMRLSITRSR